MATVEVAFTPALAYRLPTTKWRLVLPQSEIPSIARAKGEKEKKENILSCRENDNKSAHFDKKKEDFELDHLVLLLLRIMINDERQEIRRT
ncbi:hypothetical protein OUZ56_007294 [Daphnia magna]|uniref:Uncharacterized protein n=1 Tax=Daphnia magna TaxID=35525 RepID=A0ABQ9YY65_9CRUS|nr:hypothetical protein OUZ56_007294 [Daphnia magna]